MLKISPAKNKLNCCFTIKKRRKIKQSNQFDCLGGNPRKSKEFDDGDVVGCVGGLGG